MAIKKPSKTFHAAVDNNQTSCKLVKKKLFSVIPYSDPITSVKQVERGPGSGDKKVGEP